MSAGLSLRNTNSTPKKHNNGRQRQDQEEATRDDYLRSSHWDGFSSRRASEIQTETFKKKPAASPTAGK